MAEYIDRDAAIAACFDGFADCRDDCAANIRSIPAADVVERKPMPEDVEELVKDLYGFAKDCTDFDMCRDCQLAFICDDGWPPNAIAHLIETWSATHKAMTERKTGKWVVDGNGTLRCSECKEEALLTLDAIEDVTFSESRFCPNCGAKMEETNDH